MTLDLVRAFAPLVWDPVGETPRQGIVRVAQPCWGHAQGGQNP